MRASANSDETASRDWFTSAEARCSSAPNSAAGGGGRGGASARRRAPCGGARSRHGVAPRRHALVRGHLDIAGPGTSIQTSLTLLARSLSRSAGSSRMNLVRQNGWSSQARTSRAGACPGAGRRRESSSACAAAVGSDGCFEYRPAGDDLSGHRSEKAAGNQRLFTSVCGPGQRKRDSGTVLRSPGNVAR
jgi:hypothetical protein